MGARVYTPVIVDTYAEVLTGILLQPPPPVSVARSGFLMLQLLGLPRQRPMSLPSLRGEAPPVSQSHLQGEVQSDAPAPPGGNLCVEGLHPRLVVVGEKRGAHSSSTQLLGLPLTWEVGGAGYRFLVPSSGQCPVGTG